MSSDHKFQVNLQGVIDLLSDHLYTGPHVFLRELMQNSVDAIVAREKQQPDHEASISLTVIPAKQDRPATLVLEDNGIGLSEDEIHRFLATIGQSSKRNTKHSEDFIGQFGIGLLSAFVVSEEIVVLTRSLKGGSPVFEWRGRSDGTYSLKQLDAEFPIGTQVHLKPKPGADEFFTADHVRTSAAHFGTFLPYPIEVISGRQKWNINADTPWALVKDQSASGRKAALDYAEQVFGQRFLDAIPLVAKSGGVEGVAYVLPEAAVMSGKRSHRVYLKNMLLSEEADNLMPQWAFFVKCVINATKLRPTASRESFYEDRRLEQTREQLGECLKSYLVSLAKSERQKLNVIINRHHLAIKALAVEDEDFFRLFIDWLPFDTNHGQTTLGEYFANETEIRHVPSLDQFRQIASVATSQSETIFNTGYVYDADLFERLSELFPDRQVTQVNVSEFAESFEDLSEEETDEVFELQRTADRVLQPFRCAALVKKFQPTQLPTLFTSNDSANFLRSVDQSKDVADSLWNAVLDGISQLAIEDAYAKLCLNFNNPLIRRLAALKKSDASLLKRAIEMLYVQSLLMAHFPLKKQEMNLLTTGMLGLIELALESRDG
ncbi:MAG: HSP90 family protein [Planctomycetota bacterium]